MPIPHHGTKFRLHRKLGKVVMPGHKRLNWTPSALVICHLLVNGNDGTIDVPA
jgi:hypothetical protein